MILITGGDGQLGKALREFLPDAIYMNHLELDLRAPNLEDRIKELNPDIIINCAAIVGKVDYAEKEPVESIEVNAVAVHRMLSAMHDSSGFIQISTDYVNADNVYGIIKRLAEVLVKLRNGLVIRTSWLFGDGNNWVQWTLANYDKPLTIVSDQISRPTYARDLARVIAKSIGMHGVMNVQNTGEPVSWYDYAKVVCELKGVDCKFTPIGTKDYRSAHPEVAERPLRSVMVNRSDMPDWRVSLQEYLHESR